MESGAVLHHRGGCSNDKRKDLVLKKPAFYYGGGKAGENNVHICIKCSV